MKTLRFIANYLQAVTPADCKPGSRGFEQRRWIPRLRPRGMTIVGAVCVLSSAFSFASGPGTTTAELLKIPIGARAIGMGEAYTAAADDSSALAWNPAGLSFARQKEAAFMHSSLIEGVHYEHLAFMAPGDNYSFGASMSYLGYGDIAGYDAGGASIGSQSAYSYILSGGLSTLLHDRVSIGLTGSVIRQTLADESAGTFAANLGTIYSPASHPLAGDYRLGLSVLNIGPGLKFISERDPLPRKIKFGAAAMHIQEWPMNLTADVTIPNDNSTYLALGSEYWFKEIIALRLGYIGSNDEGKGIRLGVGLKLREFLFDYAYGGFGDFGATHRIGMAFRFGETMKQLNRDQRAILKEAKKAGDQGDYIQQILAMNELLEKDPTNDHILKRMIGAHKKMLDHELKEAIAQTSDQEIPSPEEFALQDLVPGQQAVVQNKGIDPMDPLGLNRLPDAMNLDIAPTTPTPVTEPQAAPSPAPDTKPAGTSSATSSSGDGVLLSPEQIYGQ